MFNLKEMNAMDHKQCMEKFSLDLGTHFLDGPYLVIGPTPHIQIQTSAEMPLKDTCCWHCCYSFFIFFKIYLFLEIGEARKRGRERSMISCLSHAPSWGPGPKPRHGALIRNLTFDLSLCGTTPNSLSHAGQGWHCCYS